jgi:ribokinase
MADIVVVGSLNMDLVVRVGSLPAAGETVAGGDLQTIPGGKGANQAVAAARLGAQVAMIGRVGADAFGERLRGSLRDAGVDVSPIAMDPSTVTGTAVIEVSEKGENTIVISAGANGRVTPADIDRHAGLLREAKVLLLQLEIPMETVVHAARVAHAASTCVVLNPAPARELPAELYPLVDLLVPNETEAARLTGILVTDQASAEQAARGVLARGAAQVIVTLGSKGSLWVSRAESQFQPAFHVDAVDTTAAGDAFIGGLATGLAQKAPFAKALRMGSAAGALAATRFGAQTSLPTLEELGKFLQKNGG